MLFDSVFSACLLSGAASMATWRPVPPINPAGVVFGSRGLLRTASRKMSVRREMDDDIAKHEKLFPGRSVLHRGLYVLDSRLRVKLFLPRLLGRWPLHEIWTIIFAKLLAVDKVFLKRLALLGKLQGLGHKRPHISRKPICLTTFHP
jgi:hypothetical protein